jgi:hypothetical protein
MSALSVLVRLYQSWAKNAEQRCDLNRILVIDYYSDLSQRKANGVDVSIDAGDLEGMTTEDLRKKYDAQARGNAGVPGASNKEDFSDLIAKESAKKKQKMERDSKKGGKDKGYKF